MQNCVIIILVMNMKDFLKRFFDVFVALCLVTFLILITYYSETCNSFFAICLIFVSVFTIALTFVNQYFKMKNKLTKWLYLLGISSSGIYLILNACRYFAINQLINSKIYSIFCMLFLALSIVIFVLLLYTTIRLMFNKNYTFQSFDIIGIKKILNLLACISVTIIMT